MQSLENRIVELETKLAFLEQGNQELSDFIYTQQQRFERRLELLEARFQRLEQSDAQAPTEPLDEKPPHY